ncbi:helix-turn-helix transcriptional regulator [Pseudonocardia dioxanivorans]|uniref:helix-turn-helix transcriptional regulator n=1 Tax=Pseudonocardia dioxanivorans TaxID=240495 RepID=UPI002D79043D|nr:helix-turn-helix transcriptional regulator [Pseudonocardia dioxanivorans]
MSGVRRARGGSASRPARVAWPGMVGTRSARPSEYFRGTRLRPDLARTHLVYGEWLRRRGRRSEARTQLRIAHDLFVSIGMEAFAARTRRELRAVGAAVPGRGAVPAGDELTAQERQIALMVREGMTNPEIAARLFLSPRTVEWHLRRVFGKLSISSRRQLRSALAPDGIVTLPARPRGAAEPSMG